MRKPGSFVVALALAAALFGQTAPKPAKPIAIRCGRLIDGKSTAPRSHIIVVIEGDRIRHVGSGVSIPPGAEIIDLSRSTVLPGLIDNHTHILLQGDITAADYDEQLLKQRIVDGPSADLHGSLDTLDRIAAFARSEPTVLLPAHNPLAEHRLAERITLTD